MPYLMLMPALNILRVPFILNEYTAIIFFKRYAQNQKIEKPNNLRVFEGNKTKCTKQDSQNRVMSPMLGWSRQKLKC